MGINSLLSSVVNTCTGSSYYRFSNADDKVWLMPSRNMRVAMNLYQPSGRNGKLVKVLFPFLHRISLVRKAIHAERLYCSLAGELQRLLGRLFHEAELTFSIFCGTPCAHQKITIQLSKGNHILGYCKVTDSPEIDALFQNEAHVLKELNRKGVKGIPECLLYDELKGGVKLFVQSTVKTQKSKVLHHWTPLHDDFLDTLYRITHKSVIFEESDYYQTLRGLLKHIDWLPEDVNSNLIITTINGILSRYQGQEVDFSAYHADFTPWNLFAENGKLFVFDWEYARMSYPPLLDRYHFFTQTAIFERHWHANEIISFLQTNKADWINEEAYVFYLSDAIARFTLREKGRVNGDITRSMKIWNDLLKYFCK